MAGSVDTDVDAEIGSPELENGKAVDAEVWEGGWPPSQASAGDMFTEGGCLGKDEPFPWGMYGGCDIGDAQIHGSRAPPSSVTSADNLLKSESCSEKNGRNHFKIGFKRVSFLVIIILLTRPGRVYKVHPTRIFVLNRWT